MSAFSGRRVHGVRARARHLTAPRHVDRAVTFFIDAASLDELRGAVGFGDAVLAMPVLVALVGIRTATFRATLQVSSSARAC